MSAGILNRTIVDYETKQFISVDDLRERILDRNLPPPIPFELRNSEFTNYFEQLGRVINIPNNTAGEQVTFNEDNSLQVIGFDERNVTLNYNPYIADESSYYEYVFPSQDNITLPRLEDLYSQYINNGVIRNSYPYYSTNDKFKLLSSGDEIGRRDPYGVIQTNGVSTSTESGLGIIGLEQLNNTIINVRTLKETQQNQEIPNKYIDGITNKSIKSYRLTEDTTVNRGIEYTQFLQGAKTYDSILPNEAIGWNEYSKTKGNTTPNNILSNLNIKSDTALSTEGRSLEMLAKTSDGQKLLLYSNFSNNKYIPNYQDPRITDLLGENAPNSRYYIGDEKSTNRGDIITKVFLSEQFNDGEGDNQKRTTILKEDDFQWKLNGGEFNEKTLLQKTQNIVNNNSDRVFIDQTAKYFKDTRTGNYISRGSAIKQREEDATSYFRVWTKDNQYSYAKAIKGMDNGNFRNRYKGGRDKASLSVLGINNLPKIYPTPLDRSAPLKKYMLSIENLAWAGYDQDLPEFEKGNGDLDSGNRGRIMWFAPYDLSFDESVTANWTSTDFLGRGEPVYTYNNTKRSGSLKFKMIVDHPSIINEFRGRQSNLLEKYFSGGRTTDEILGDFLGLNIFDLNTERAIELALNEIQQQLISKPSPNDLRFSVFFEPGNSNITNSISAEIQSLKDSLENSSELSITLEGYSGTYEKSEKNDGKELAGNRIEVVKQEILNAGIKVNKGENGRDLSDKDFKEKKYGNTKFNGELSVFGELNGSDENVRRVEVIVRYNIGDGLNDILDEKTTEDPSSRIRREFLNFVTFDESNYFSFIDQNYPNYFKTISEKIKYFHPGFHSYTPESLNSRLTFLHQCTRQGNSINLTDANIKPKNLAFGKPPVCILRIGDFFHSKVIINSLSLTYGAGGGSPQWDLNPDGIGIQPMMVDVSMSIDIIGGQSLFAPINQLQNAMSFNFYANTEMYDKRSSSVVFKNGKPELNIPNYPYPNRVKGSNVTTTKDNEKTEPTSNQTNNNNVT